MSFFFETLDQFNKGYSRIFDKRDKEEAEDQEPGDAVGRDRFTEHYGWIYNAEQVADYERIKLSEAFNLPVVQFLNGLTYIKAKNNYQKYIDAGNTE